MSQDMPPTIIAIALFFFAGTGNAMEKFVELDNSVYQFTQDYCIKCHGPEKQKGDRAFHQISKLISGKQVVDLAEDETVHLLHDLLDQLNLGEMPPKKEGVAQPKPDETKRVIGWLTKTLLELEKQKGPKQTVLRRLNRREYRNTMRDLLGLQDLAFDFTENFPTDEKNHGFTNVGDALSLSDQHLNAYLEAADRYLRMAFRFEERTPFKSEIIKPNEWGYRRRQDKTPWMYRVYKPNQYLDFAAGKKQISDHFDLGTFPHDWYWKTKGIQTPGYYKIIVTAEAVNRLTHPYDPKMIPTNLKPPMQLALFVSRGNKGLASDSEKSRSKIGLWDLADHQPEKFEVTVWLDKSDAPFLNWDNGPGPSDYWMRDICEKYHTDIEFRGKQGFHAWHIIGKDLVPGRVVSDVWKGPVVRLHEFRINGPLPITYQSKAQQVFLNGERDLSKVDLGIAFSRFARRAFRRPVTGLEIEPYLEIEKRARQNLGRNRQEAFFIALKAMLVSPDFLYLKEEKSESGKLAPFEIANRLSHFLWSSLPDHSLFQKAKENKLKHPKAMKHEIVRLLDDPKSESFVHGFAESWLRLDKLGTMPPASQKFHEYYRYGLKDAMLEETHQFLAHAMEKNVPITDFIQSGYGFINQDLARHYGIEGVEGVHFRKVSFPENSMRGGLIGQASILTLTANGVDTSPVIRGIWVLESILGTPPSPPPPDVEPINPDVRGAKTVKQLLEMHRSVQACADCHAKIDPLGFPLEYFDPVGGYRPTYYRSRLWKNSTQTTQRFPAKPIDGSSTLSSGEKIYGPRTLKTALLSRKNLLAQNIAEKLIIYATGRMITLQDKQEAEAIAHSILSEKLGFRDLIIKIASSQAFARK
jgi:mono/diheme cytochrome c family protein